MTVIARSMIRHTPECASVAAVVACDCGGWVPRAACAEAVEVKALQQQLQGAVDIAQMILDTWGGKELHSETAELAVELAEHVLAATTTGGQ